MNDLSQFPPSTQNNSRAIVREAINRFKETPNDRNRKVLESYGFTVDQDDYFEHYDEIERRDEMHLDAHPLS